MNSNLKFSGKSFRGFLPAAMICMASILSLAGCGKTASPDSITIQPDGTEAEDHIYVLDKTQDTLELTAVLDPSDFDGEVTWTSSDAGVVKISSTDGNSCMLSLIRVGYATVTASCGEASDTVVVTIQKNQDALSEKDIAVTVNDTAYSVEKLNFFFVDTYNQFAAYYGNYASEYGLDVSQGIAGLADEECDYSSDGTWKGYFAEQAVNGLIQDLALCSYADENGITLSEGEEQLIQEKLDAMAQKAEEKGCSSTDAYVEKVYGDNATLELYEEYLRMGALAAAAYDAYSDSLTYTDEEIEAHYEEMGYTEEDGNDYPTVSMRHILIMAEADENGEYTDEAIQAAHEKAEELYEEWQAGDATEDSFAELADEYSEDTGSNTTGGLYEDIYKNQMVSGINDWLFEKGRTAGDTTVIDNNGSYVGTHIVYFCGQGEDYSTYLSVSDLKSTDITAWQENLESECEAVNGAAYDQIGEIN